MIFDEDDEDDDEDEDEDEVEDLNVIAIKRYTVMNGIGFNTFLLFLEQVTDEIRPTTPPPQIIRYSPPTATTVSILSLYFQYNPST